MHCSTPQTTIPRWLCEVFSVQIASLRNEPIGLTFQFANVSRFTVALFKETDTGVL